MRKQEFKYIPTKRRHVILLYTDAIYILGFNSSLSLLDVGLRPPDAKISNASHARIGGGPLFDPDRLNLNETSSVGRLEATKLVHRRFLCIVQTLHRRTRIRRKTTA